MLLQTNRLHSKRLLAREVSRKKNTLWTYFPSKANPENTHRRKKYYSFYVENDSHLYISS